MRYKHVISFVFFICLTVSLIAQAETAATLQGNFKGNIFVLDGGNDDLDGSNLFNGIDESVGIYFKSYRSPDSYFRLTCKYTANDWSPNCVIQVYSGKGGKVDQKSGAVEYIANSKTSKELFKFFGSKNFSYISSDEKLKINSTESAFSLSYSEQ